MTANKFKLLVAPWLVAAAIAGGTVALSRGEAKPDPPVTLPLAVTVATPARTPELRSLATPLAAGDTRSWVTVTGVTYSPDGKRFAVSPGVTVRDPAGKVLYTVPGYEAGFSADGKTLFVMGSKTVTFHDAETGKETKSFPRPVTNVAWHLVAFSPDGSRYAAHFGFGVRVFDTATGFEPVRLENQREPGGSGLRGLTGKQVAFSPDGKRVVAVGVLVASGQMGAVVWDAATGSRLHTTEADFNSSPLAAAFSADGKRFVIGSNDKIVMHDAATFKVVKELAFRGQPTELVFSPDGKTLAIGNRAPPGMDGWTGKALAPVTTVRVIDAETGNVRHSLGGLPDLPVNSIAFAPDGTSIVAGTGIKMMTPFDDHERIPGGLKVWRLDAVGAFVPAAVTTGWKEKEIEPLTHHAGPVDSVAWSPDGTSFVSGGADGRVLIWDAATRTPKELGAVIPAGKRTAVAFSPDGKLVAATRDKVTGFFDPVKRQVVQMNPPFPGGTAVAFAPVGFDVAVSNGKQTVIRSRPPRGDITLTPHPDVEKNPDSFPAGVAWSPDGKQFAHLRHEKYGGTWPVVVSGIGIDGDLTLLRGHTEITTAVAWSGDGKRIATGARDGQVIVWDAATFKEQHRVKITGRNGSSTIHALAFSPDGITLAAAVQLDAGKGVDRVILIDAATGKQGDFMQVNKQLRAVAFSPDGKTLLGAFGIDRSAMKPVLTPDELKAAGGIAVWQRP